MGLKYDYISFKKTDFFFIAILLKKKMITSDQAPKTSFFPSPS